MSWSADVLHIYNWSGSLSSSTIKKFEAYCSCKVIQDFYGDNEEMLAKLSAGANGYDVVFPSSFVVGAMTKQKLLQPLDHKQLPNLKNMNPAYMNQSYDLGNQYTIPNLLSLTSIGFNKQKIESLGLNPYSWSLIFDPKVLSKIKGRVTVLDSSREVFAAALMYLGLDPNTSKEEDYIKAKDIIKKAKPYWATFSNAGYVKELATGNIWAALGYSPEFFQASEDVKQSRRPFEILNVAQKEGNELGVDTMAILRKAKRPDLAHKFINFMMDGKNAAELTNINGAINPVRTSSLYFREDLKAHPLINPNAEYIKKWVVLRELDPKERRTLSKLWTQVKVGQ